jgi:peptidoglycan LD-endopeptidase LytH
LVIHILVFFLLPIEMNLNDLCQLWNKIYEKIQYGTVDRRIAGKALRTIITEIHAKVHVPADTDMYFPVEGYGLQDVGGQGSGFIPRQYNFLHGNVHRGHPAHDIFIQDRDMDAKDDKTKQHTRVLAMTGGIVIGRKTDWTPGDTLRGGNYLMIYNPNLFRYYYYAHNDSILVDIGQIVKAGDPVATVGRTGRTASLAKSPTHLHLMVLQLSAEKTEPYNYYDELKKSVFTQRP